MEVVVAVVRRRSELSRKAMKPIVRLDHRPKTRSSPKQFSGRDVTSPGGIPRYLHRMPRCWIILGLQFKCFQGGSPCGVLLCYCTSNSGAIADMQQQQRAARLFGIVVRQASNAGCSVEALTNGAKGYSHLWLSSSKSPIVSRSTASRYDNA